jgi:two-component system response regulator YesN
MYRVLVVDDEIYAVKGMIDGVDWNRLGVVLVHEAYRAQEAKAILDSEPVDLMICDIEMPEENGLELLAWAREKHPELETIFLTCHADFGYAQQAVQLGSRDYLLKPVMYDELEDVLARNLERVRKKRNESEETERFKKYYRLWHQQRPELINMFWRDVMSRGGEKKKKKLEQVLQACELPLEGKENLLLILLSVEEWSKPLSAFDEELMGYALRKAAEEVIIGEHAGHVIEDEFGNSIVILYVQGKENPGQEEWKRRCEAYIQACRTYFFCRLSCYIGEVLSFDDVNAGYHGLLEMEYHNVSEHNRVLFYKDRLNSGGAEEQVSFLHWTEWLECGDMERLDTLVNETFEWIRSRQGKGEWLTKVYHGVLQVVYYVLLRKGLTPEILYEQGLPSDPSEATRSSVHLRQWIEQMIGAVVGLPEPEQRGRQVNSIVREIQTYIGGHLDQELTRDDLSAHVHLNASYLSRLFRKETGMSLSDYILQERMRKAAELLTATDESVSSIAIRLGYDNFSYFAKMFKKVYRMTPQEYRKTR